MNAFLYAAPFGLAALALPAAAQQPTPEQQEVYDGVDAFFQALSSSDKTQLRSRMLPEGTIFVHNRMDRANPSVDAVPVARHLERWEAGTTPASEQMRFDGIQLDGDMATVWGPYAFYADGQVSHCGVNVLSMVRTDDGWKVGNTSFTMVPPEQCAQVGVDWLSAF